MPYKSLSDIAQEYSAHRPRPFGKTEPLMVGLYGFAAAFLIVGTFLVLVPITQQDTRVAFLAVCFASGFIPWAVVHMAQRRYDGRVIELYLSDANADDPPRDAIEEGPNGRASGQGLAGEVRGGAGTTGVADFFSKGAGERAQREQHDETGRDRDEAALVFAGAQWDSVRHLPFRAVYYDCWQMHHDDTLYPIGCYRTLAEAEAACRTFVDVQLLERLAKTTPEDTADALLESILTAGNMPMVFRSPIPTTFSGAAYVKERAMTLLRNRRIDTLLRNYRNLRLVPPSTSDLVPTSPSELGKEQVQREEETEARMRALWDIVNQEEGL